MITVVSHGRETWEWRKFSRTKEQKGKEKHLNHPILCRRCSVAQLCPMLCDPLDCSMPGLPCPHHLPEFAQVHVHCIDDAIQPSYGILNQFFYIFLLLSYNYTVNIIGKILKQQWPCQVIYLIFKEARLWDHSTFISNSASIILGKCFDFYDP